MGGSRRQKRLSVAEREDVVKRVRAGVHPAVAAGDSAQAIARRLGRAPSTITRELRANGGRERYRALRAQRRAIACTARPKAGKLSRSSRLRSEVAAGLKQRCSPQQISATAR